MDATNLIKKARKYRNAFGPDGFPRKLPSPGGASVILVLSGFEGYDDQRLR